MVKSGALIHSAMQSDDALVRVYGDTAIVTVRVVRTGANQGRGFASSERSTDISCADKGMEVRAQAADHDSDQAIERGAATQGDEAD